MVNVVFVEAGGRDLFCGQASGELVDDGADHLQVRQFVSAPMLEMVFSIKKGQNLRVMSSSNGGLYHPLGADMPRLAASSLVIRMEGSR